MVLNATVNNISVISWRSYNPVYVAYTGFELIAFVVIGTGCIDSY